MVTDGRGKAFWLQHSKHNLRMYSFMATDEDSEVLSGCNMASINLHN